MMAKAEQRLALEGGHKDAPQLQAGGRYAGKPAEYAMHKFAYYICYRSPLLLRAPPLPRSLSSCFACVCHVRTMCRRHGRLR